MCLFGSRQLTAPGREAESGRVRFGGSGAAGLAAWGHCGLCFVKGRRTAEGGLGAAGGGRALWHSQGRGSPVRGARPRLLFVCL